MAIDQLLQFSVFEPDQIACMRAAYEDALDALQPMQRQGPINRIGCQEDYHRSRADRRARSGSITRKGAKELDNCTGS